MSPALPSTLARLLNVPAMLRYLRQHRADKSVWDPADDLELALYATIFGNNFLHYGYFHDPAVDPESLSFASLKQAMDDYATLVVERVRTGERVLDVGCGMGGLLARLERHGAQPTGLTPNRAQAAHVRSTWPNAYSVLRWPINAPAIQWQHSWTMTISALPSNSAAVALTSMVRCG